MTLISRLNKKYVEISNRVSNAYTDKMGLLCDIYLPKNKLNPDANETYNEVNIFEPHQVAEYNDEPSYTDIKFYIPHLLKKEAMNSSEAEFDAFYLADEAQRPFIECSKSNELPIQTKVVVKLENSKMYFFVDKKTVINGADGHMLLRQYLSPLSKG